MNGADRVAYVRAHGSPFTVGRAHGAVLAPQLRTFLDDDVCRLNRLLPAPVSVSSLKDQLDAYGTAIAAGTPALYDEIRGLAVGADMTLHEALLLQVRREILGYRRVPTMGDCTTYARVDPDDPGSSVLAQTVDLNGDMDDVIGVLRVGTGEAGHESLVLSFAGLLGYLGINSRGLAIGINLVLGGRWRPGVPPYLAIRHLLDTTGNVDEAVAALRDLRLASSRTITLCDTTSAAVVEILGDEMWVSAGRSTTHTNHFLNPAFAPHDELNVFARTSSVRRLDACRAGLATLAPTAGPAEHLALLSRAPMCVAGHGDIRTERTVAAVVMLPDRRELHLRPGDPSRSATRVYSLATRELRPPAMRHNHDRIAFGPSTR